jgi:hypothetical protein
MTLCRTAGQQHIRQEQIADVVTYSQSKQVTLYP